MNFDTAFHKLDRGIWTAAAAAMVYVAKKVGLM
jgi:hypothetical protein